MPIQTSAAITYRVPISAPAGTDLSRCTAVLLSGPKPPGQLLPGPISITGLPDATSRPIPLVADGEGGYAVVLTTVLAEDFSPGSRHQREIWVCPPAGAGEPIMIGHLVTPGTVRTIQVMNEISAGLPQDAGRVSADRGRA